MDELTTVRVRLSDLERCNTDLDRLEAENEKLRELVQDYDRELSSMHTLCDCDFVPLNDAALMMLRSRMHGLGIEVGGD